MRDTMVVVVDGWMMAAGIKRINDGAGEKNYKGERVKIRVKCLKIAFMNDRNAQFIPLRLLALNYALLLFTSTN